jgi:lipopolysaccharide transport system ATP-binding protein
MKKTTAIKVEGISKRYLIAKAHQPDTVRDQLMEWSNLPKRLLSNAWREQKEEFWALKDVSFEVKQGDVLGIIGKNGSGKSTLLKILTRITEPTSGKATMHGKVASLLEVGTGFVPELSGRENVFLNGAILGMSRSEIKKKFDEILDFSGVEQFIDTPVKRYSSGMYVRLAFAVAAHLDSDILLVDEVLAVGDAEFQKKCLGKMKDLAGGGRTVLLVSHNMQAVQSLCSNTIYLSHGKVVNHGSTYEIMRQYTASESTHNSTSVYQETEADSKKNIVLKVAKVEPIFKKNDKIVSLDTEINIVIEVQVNGSVGKTHISLVVFNDTHQPIFNVVTPKTQLSKGRHKAVLYIPANLLNDGMHSVQIIIMSETESVQNFEDILAFEVVDTSKRDGWYGKWTGAIRPILPFSFQ